MRNGKIMEKRRKKMCAKFTKWKKGIKNIENNYRQNSI